MAADQVLLVSPLSAGFMFWRGSNPRHTPYVGAALPSELQNEPAVFLI